MIIFNIIIISNYRINLFIIGNYLITLNKFIIVAASEQGG